MTPCQKPSMGKINGISVPGLPVKRISPNSCHDTTGSITPPGPPNSMLWGLRSRPIYFSQSTHPHILTHTAPALNWGCGGCGSMGSSRHEHACATSTHKRCVPLIFPIDGLLFCCMRFASRTEHGATYFAQPCALGHRRMYLVAATPFEHF